MFSKKILLLLMAGILCFSHLYVYAKEVPPPTQTTGITLDSFLNVGNFDAKLYAANYPDLATIYGSDAKALLNHYIKYGYDQGLTASGKNIATTAKIKAYRIAHEIIDENMTTYEQIKVVHDWIIQNTTYDYIRYQNGTAPTSSYYIAGVMLDGIGVCAGYADTFQFFMDVLGIPCTVITGEATSGSLIGSHAWNYVCIDDFWYHVDVTWDDSLDEQAPISYDYFLISTQEIRRNHSISKWS